MLPEKKPVIFKKVIEEQADKSKILWLKPNFLEISCAIKVSSVVLGGFIVKVSI